MLGLLRRLFGLPPYVTVVHKCPFCESGLIYPFKGTKYSYLNRACDFCDMNGYFRLRVLDLGQPNGPYHFHIRRGTVTMIPKLRGT